MRIQFPIKGKITSSEFYNGKYLTCLVTPAPDAYTQPNSYRISSQQQLGQPGAEIQCTVEISGYLHHRQYRDKNTGQMKDIVDTNVFLTVVQPQQIQQPRSASN